MSFSAPLNLQNLVTIKLTKDNFLLWRAQILPYLRGQQLIGYVDGTIPCPPPTIQITSKEDDIIKTSPNPEFSQWYNQDQVILGALMSSLSESIITHMVGLETSKDVWCALERMFSNHARARVVGIRLELSTLKKGNMSMSDYYQRIKTSADTLAAVGEPLRDSEFLTYILAGLDSSYNSIVMSISTRVDQFSLEDAYAHLLSFELRLEQQNSALDIAIGSANVATRNDHSRGNGGRTPQRSFQNSRGRNYRGRGRGSQGNFSGGGSRLICQLCGKNGHNAVQCYHRLDLSYQGT
ncbi:hypothetical protein F2P56_013107 [Juglans regia]|uniref:Retrotransposon Copia-like N-terminal domain-containing protein n=1 Tax=Juglans regia TaxID=51240 RepID=A0A833XNT4_JUGRE|nr:hypothetical protein F2P56_013107 [Juglans regia]